MDEITIYLSKNDEVEMWEFHIEINSSITSKPIYPSIETALSDAQDLIKKFKKLKEELDRR